MDEVEGLQRLRVDLTHDADYDVARHDLRRPRRMEAGPDCGAELDRLRWGAAAAREAGPSHITVGAYVNVAVGPDRDRARELVRGSVATFARFSADTEAVVGYDKDRHGEAGAAFALGGEEGLEEVIADLGQNAGAVVDDFDDGTVFERRG